MDRQEDALMAMQEATELYWQLAAEQSAAFNSSLALSLKKLSTGLAHVGRQEDALRAIQQGVEPYLRLVIDHPAAFHSDLARSLICLAQLLVKWTVMKKVYRR